MTQPFENGGVAAGKKFIGRKEELKKCAEAMKYHSRVCISVCGLPRIGKTSIVKKAMRTRSKKVLPVFVNLASLSSFFDMWRAIIRELFSCLGEAAVLFEDYRARIDDACAHEKYAPLREYLEDLFLVLSKEKYKCVVAIDEFDDIARGKFGNANQCGTYLNLLRNLFSQRPEFRLSLIIISRRDIASLESHNAVASTFHGVFGNNIIPVRGFNDNDYQQYLNILKAHGVKLSKEVLNDIETYGGRHPYLLSQIGNYLCENAGNPINLQRLSQDQGRIHYFNHLINLLRDEGYYETMIKVFVGPKYDLTVAEFNILRNLGYIDEFRENGETRRRFINRKFTADFEEAVTLEEHTNIWPELQAAEIRLREVIESALSKKYNTGWQKHIKQIYSQKYSQNDDYKQFIDFEKADKFLRATHTKYSGVKIKITLLKMLAIWELKNLINYYWDEAEIKDCFPLGTDRKDWFQKFDLMQRARDPLAHSNPEFLTNEEVSLVNIYCGEILNKVKILY